MARTSSQKNNDAIGSAADLVQQFTGALQPPVPPYDSIIDFATHDYFCGKKLYPKQRTLLKLMYLETENMTDFDKETIEEWRRGFGRKGNSIGVQKDIWHRIDYLKSQGYRHFPHIQAIQGRRGSKGVIGGVLAAEKLAFLLNLDNPQEYYGIEEGKEIYLHVIATNLLQAKKFQFADIRQTVEACKFLKRHVSTSNEYYLSLQTPADIRNIAELKADRIPIDHEIASLRVLAMSSVSSSGRGGTGAANFFDEFAFQITGTGGPRSSEEVYNAYQPSLDQFGQDSLTYMPSSPWSKVGKFFDLYVNGSVLLDSYLQELGHQFPEAALPDDADELMEELTADPEMLIVQLASWSAYEEWERGPELCGIQFKRAIQTYDNRMKRLEKRDPDKFKVERKAQFAEVQNAYLDPDKVDEMFDPFWDNRILDQVSQGTLLYAYESHADPGRVNANFALCVAHLEEAPVDEYGDSWSHVIIDYLQVWRPLDFPDHTINYVTVTKDISDIIKKFPSLSRLTFDQWNSAGTIDTLKEEFKGKPRILQLDFSDKENQNRAEYFKMALNQGWVHSYRDHFFTEGHSLLENELKFLSEVNGKVVKQSIGPVTTKDLADTVMEVSYRLLHAQLDTWKKKLLGKTSLATGLPGGKIDSTTFSSRPQRMISNGRTNRATARDNLRALRESGIARRRGIPMPFRPPSR
jgi:hypothetical protein